MIVEGLEDVIACSSAICSIENGVLTYRGINIDELAENASFEETAYLLWHGILPNRQQLEHFKKELAASYTLPEGVLSLIKSLPKQCALMDVLRTSVSALSFYDPEANEMSPESNLQKAVSFTAKFSTLVTAIERVRQGKEPIPPRQDLNIAGNFLYMLSGKLPDELSLRAFDEALVLHADHELNASTFTARGTASTLSDMYSAVVSAIGALKGPLHGGANEQVIKMILEIGDVKRTEAYIKKALSDKKRLMGFGHRVYKEGDPRAKHLKALSKQLGEKIGNLTWYEISAKVEEIVMQEKGLRPNVDFYSASVYHAMGFPSELFTPIFACSRITGWTAHILEQYANNRLIRPRANYTGPVNQHYIPIDKR